MPNPIYGSWEQAITFGDGALTDAQRLAAKFEPCDSEPGYCCPGRTGTIWMMVLNRGVCAPRLGLRYPAEPPQV